MKKAAAGAEVCWSQAPNPQEWGSNRWDQQAAAQAGEKVSTARKADGAGEDHLLEDTSWSVSSAASCGKCCRGVAGADVPKGAGVAPPSSGSFTPIRNGGLPQQHGATMDS